MTPQGRFRLIVTVICCAALLSVAWWQHRRMQAPAVATKLARRIVASLEDGEAAACMALLHPAYDVPAHWPQLAELPAGGQDPRELVRLLLGRWFLQHRGQERLVSCTVVAVQHADDPQAPAPPSERLPEGATPGLVVTLQLAFAAPPQVQVGTQQRVFWLAPPDWWSASSLILAHEPIALR